MSNKRQKDISEYGYSFREARLETYLERTWNIDMRGGLKHKFEKNENRFNRIIDVIRHFI
jgi:hypothetical protein